MIAGRNSYQAQLLRTLLVSVDDSGPQQLVKVTGLAGQTIGEAVRSQHFGLTSVPPADAEGLALLIGGGADRAHMLGLEHPQKRPTNTSAGGTRLYDAYGNQIYMQQSDVTTTHSKKIVFKVGSNTLTIDSNGFHYANGSIDHDGHKIDKTHVHTDAGGVGLSGPPP